MRRRIAWCDCGNRKGKNARGCLRCQSLDGATKGASDLIYCLRIIERGTQEEIARFTGMKGASVSSALASMMRRGRVRKAGSMPGIWSLVDPTEVLG